MLDKEALVKEFVFKAIRSSGSGGQHVNKVATKIEISFSLLESSVLNEVQKARIQNKLSNRLTKENVIQLQCGESRSQLKNKNTAIDRLINILETALKVQKQRKPTKIPRAVIKKRLKNKRLRSERKGHRKKPDLD